MPSSLCTSHFIGSSQAASIRKVMKVIERPQTISQQNQQAIAAFATLDTLRNFVDESGQIIINDRKHAIIGILPPLTIASGDPVTPQISEDKASPTAGHLWKLNFAQRTALSWLVWKWSTPKIPWFIIIFPLEIAIWWASLFSDTAMLSYVM